MITNIKLFLRNFLPLALLIFAVLPAEAQTMITSPSLPDFKKVNLMGNINVVCIVDSLAGNEIEWSETLGDFTNYFYITLEKQTLNIRLTTEENIGKARKLPVDTLRLRVKDLKEVINEYDATLSVRGLLSGPSVSFKTSGNGTIEATDVACEKLRISSITGSGNIRINQAEAREVNVNMVGTGAASIMAGSCDILKIKSVGTGKLYFKDLRAQDVKINYSGGGYVVCNAAKTLETIGLGTTKIEYLGNPVIKRKSNVKPRPFDSDDFTVPDK